MTDPVRRAVLLRSLRAAPVLLALPALLSACATTGFGGGGVDEGLRRLLEISSRRALTRLAAPDGYLGDPALRLAVPRLEGRSGAVLAALLQSRPVQDQLLTAVNRAASRAADRAAPVVYDAVRALTFRDALGIARGGPSAATDYLEGTIGDGIVTAMLPEVGDSLRALDEGSILGPVLGAATGVDVTGIERSVTDAAAQGLWRAIGREEAAIRADPRSAHDRLVEALLTGGRLLG